MQGGARDRTGAYTAVREDASPNRQRGSAALSSSPPKGSNRPLSTDQALIPVTCNSLHTSGIVSVYNFETAASQLSAKPAG